MLLGKAFSEIPPPQSRREVAVNLTKRDEADHDDTALCEASVQSIDLF